MCCMYFQGSTALHLAALRNDNNLEVIQVLLINGCKPDIKDKQVNRK